MRDGRVAEAFGGGDRIAMRFDLLMAPYVLTALSEVEMTKAGRNLKFSSKGRRRGP